MYPTIADLIKDVTGYHVPFPVPTFLFFLMIAGALASWVLSLELKRKEQKNYLRGYYNSKGMYIRPNQQSGTIILIALLFGLAGARLFSLLENPDPFGEAPLFVLFSSGGFIFSGGLIIGTIAVVIYAKTKNLRLTHLLDASAPSLSIAYAVGRMGCYLSGDWVCGINNDLEKPSWLRLLPDWLWIYQFPQAGMESHPELSTTVFSPVFPTQLYEALICGFIFCALWGSRKKITIPGLLFSLYLLCYGTERFLMEKIRTGRELNLLYVSVTQAEMIAFFLIITGCLLCYTFFKKHRQKSTHYTTFLKLKK